MSFEALFPHQASLPCATGLFCLTTFQKNFTKTGQLLLLLLRLTNISTSANIPPNVLDFVGINVTLDYELGYNS
jgi:hypothetical protein